MTGGTGKATSASPTGSRRAPLAGLALRASQAWHRGNASYLDGDIDETRLVVDYSRSIW